ncbi:MAG: oligosaccharide flippase family protein [Isosphaeraceae bacterium]
MPGNAAWATVGNLAIAGGQWLILVVLAKLGSPNLLGRYALALAVTGPVMLLANLQLRSLLVVDAAHRHPFGEYLALRIATASLALVAIAVGTLALGQPQDAALLVVAVGSWRGMEAIGEIAQGLCQQRERMDLVACSQVLRAVLAVLAMGSILAWTGSVLLGAWAMAGIGTLVLVLFDLPSAARVLGPDGHAALRPRWELRRLGQLARRAFPLGVAMMLSSLLVNVPRYAISHYAGDDALGSYAAVASLLVVISLMTTALGQSASPRLAGFAARGQWRSYHRLLSRLMVLGLLIGMTGLAASELCGRQILTILFDATYARDLAVFRIVMLAAAVASVATPLGFALTAGGHHAVQIPLLVVVTSGVACCSRILVPRLGAIGGAWSLVVGYLLLVVGSLVILGAAERRRRRLG